MRPYCKLEIWFWLWLKSGFWVWQNVRVTWVGLKPGFEFLPAVSFFQDGLLQCTSWTSDHRHQQRVVHLEHCSSDYAAGA